MKCRIDLLSPQLSLRSQAPPIFTLALCDFLLGWKLMLDVNTLPWFWQALSRWGAEKTGELGWKTRGSSVLFGGESRREGGHSRNLTCCPLTFCPIPVPCNQFTRWTCLPTQPELLGNWNDYQVATWGVSRSPREVNLAGDRLGAQPQHWPPGGPGKPTQGRARFPEKPTPAPEPRHLSADAQTQARSFPDRGQARPAPGSPRPSAHRTVRAKHPHCRKCTVSSKHHQYRQDLERSKPTM